MSYVNKKIYIVMAVMLCTLMALAFAPKAHAADINVNNAAGDDTTAIQNAIDGANSGDRVLLEPQSSGGCYELSEVSNTDRAILLNDDDDGITLESSVEDSRVCLNRNVDSDVRPFDGFKWFAWTRDAQTNGTADNFVMDDINMDGLETNLNGYVFWPDDWYENPNNTTGQENDWDIAIHMAPSVVGDGDDRSKYVQFATFRDVTINNLSGVCWYSRYSKIKTLDNVNCIDPTKDGYTFGPGSWGDNGNGGRGVLNDVKATLTGDDALAFNSCWTKIDYYTCARAGNFTVTGGGVRADSKFSVDVDTKHGAAFYSRAGSDIYISSSEFGRSATGNGGNDRRGSMMIEDATGLNSSGGQTLWGHSVDVQVSSNNEVNPGGELNGVWLDDGSLSNILIGGNVINYFPNPEYGIKASSATNKAAITGEGSNTYNPNNATWNHNL